MPRIHKLDPALVNKIAAGEVIERPASVVKELIENALDAGAGRIDVALADGGARLIHVTDDGCGIDPDDLPLAVAAHATSKLESTDDLFRIRTLGFRGEALASIAAVSRLSIRSRTADRPEGYALAFEETEPPILADAPAVGGVRIAPCAAPVGTTVEVRQLFFNVPARRKFLRQAPTELAQVTEAVARLALAHSGVAFSLAHNDRPLRTLPPTADRRTRIADFYGADLAQCLIPIRREERGLGIEALIAPPAESRASSKWQYIFLNGRYITDRRIGFALREAYRGLVENGRYPVVFLFLTADPGDYDVNVHPTKIEVRWKDAGLVQSQVLAALRETMLGRNLTPGLSLQRSTTGDSVGAGAAGAGSALNPHQERARQAMADYLKSVDPTQARLRFEPPPFPTRNLRPSIRGTLVPPRAERMDSSAIAPTGEGVGRDDDASGGKQTDPPAVPRAGREERETIDTSSRDRGPGDGSLEAGAAMPPAVPAEVRAGPGQAIQIHNTYLVAQTAEGIIIVDQHALHERILYERFRERLLAGPLESQRLLIPRTLAATPARLRAAEQHAAMLWRLGIEVGQTGPRALAVQAFPVLLGNEDIETFVADILDRLGETEAFESEETHIHRVLDLMACKAAVKAGDALTEEEIQALLAQRDLVERSSNCPHGRPTTLQLTTRDLERQFRRT